MIDFMTVSTRMRQRGTVEIYPKFIIKKSSDLMIRGGDFYAVWVEDRGLWSTDEQDALQLIDRELDNFAKENSDKYGDSTHVLHMWDAESGMIDSWHKYCQKQMRDSYTVLDEKLIFSNMNTQKGDFASKRLKYPLETGDISGYNRLISTLYSEEERHKIEWAIGSIVAGDSKKIQKFLVLYGAAGTGKSTILNIVQQLFEGYYSVFDAKALGSNNNSFALESFKSNPLVAIQHDGDLSRIEDNTRLNSLVSHELMTVNEKFKSTYANRFKCFLFMGTNKPVKITDGRSGLLRRLIDVTPTGKKLAIQDYRQAMEQVKFELGAIASHCRDVYLSDPSYYDDYIPITMMGASNDFYNFIIDSYHIFKKEDGTTLTTAWEMYKQYCDDAKVPFPYSMKNFKEELKNYFWNFQDRMISKNGTKLKCYYSGFRTDKFEDEKGKTKSEITTWLNFQDNTKSIFDEEFKDCPAQYATPKETPYSPWDSVKTKLSDIVTTETHYVMPPSHHVVVDFDLKGDDGKKSLERNIESASMWKKTYAELSKSGCGIHLHYNYTGDISELQHLYDKDIEIKVFTGNSSLRRKLTKCNDIPIATINSGLPIKGRTNMINFDGIKSEKTLRKMIKKNLNREYHANTKPSIDYINHLLNESYENGIHYDVSDMKNAIMAFAMESTNQADKCLKIVSNMKFKSDDSIDEIVEEADSEIAFYDVEVFPNLFLVNWKIIGESNPVVRMINPTPSEIENLMHYRLIGFNCRRYDNHMLYGRLIGYSNEQLYDLSQKIVSGNDKKAFFGEAYNISYTDVYDFCSKKQSLKKWEIELGIHHQELGLPWDQPVPEELWSKVAEYCDNDVIATEAVFNARQADFDARKFQVDLVKIMHGISNVTVNDTTNTLSAKIIFGNNKNPQNVFNYRDLAKPVSWEQYDEYREKFGPDYEFHIFDENGLPTYDIYDGSKCTVLPDGWSILPFFPCYRFEAGKSVYIHDKELRNAPWSVIEDLIRKTDPRIEVIGEGGRVYSNPGIHTNVWDADISSQHPHSVIYEVLFGPEYTKRFKDIVDARVAIKHRDFDIAGQLLSGVLKPFLKEELASSLAQALKIIINSIYGLTSAAFVNPFRDIRNRDNIVAKRGALFMTMLKGEVQKQGYTVAHIKTDSIKIPNSDEHIMDFVIQFGKEFGYGFDTEAEFSKFCLVNDAVYVAKFKEPEINKKTGEKKWWTATGTQFQVPYVFKTLFSKQPIEFNDMCETKSVSSAIYLDMNENLNDVTEYENLKAIRKKAPDKFSRSEQKLFNENIHISDEELDSTISSGHNYVFVGKVGQFCPMQPGYNGGILLREVIDKKTGERGYAAVTGSKGYRWLESEMVRELGKEDGIDQSYYKRMVDDAVETISQYGDIEWFTSDDESDNVPPWSDPDEPWTNDTLFNVR